ncbi:MAG: cbb3-type cytochrome c oxidase subunit I [Pseudomonadales bacterium]
MANITYDALTPTREVPADADTLRSPLGWLWLSVYSLIGAGLMSLLLALARTPLIQNVLENPALFKVALVVHVDLSALVWFCACASLLWSLLIPDPRGLWGRGALGLSVIGTAMLTLAPFIGAPLPIMNNYVPVLEQSWFLAALGLVAAGVCVGAWRYLAACRGMGLLRAMDAMSCVRLAMALVAVMMLLSAGCLGLSYAFMPAGLSGEIYYDLLFWGSGHVLQVAYTLMALAAWIVLVRGLDKRYARQWGWIRWLLIIAVVPTLMVPWAYLPELDAREHVLRFTEMMRWGGVAAIPLVLLAFAGLLASRSHTPEGGWLRAAALCSLSLFAVGGIMGFLIRGSNTMIPAHYHGSIVGVTLALMGLVYFVLPRLSRPITMPRAALWQPYIYASGQLMHVTGLAWCGGYGVQRKVSGTAQGLDGIAQTAGMGLMGLGGLVSVLGGMLFLIVVISALRPLVSRTWNLRSSET